MQDPPQAWTRATLPRPFADDPWKDQELAAVTELWDWHQRLPDLIEDTVELERLRGSVLDVCRRYDLDSADVTSQEEVAREFAHPVRVESMEQLDDLVDRWTAAHGRLLAGLAGIGKYTWQQEHIFAMSRGFALTASLMVLPEDLADDRVLFPLADLDRGGVTVEELRRGRMTPSIKKLIWKEVVRARDSFAQARRAIDDLDRRQAAAFRRWWFAALEILNKIEANDFDVFTRPPRLSRYSILHARFQARFGRTTFR